MDNTTMNYAAFSVVKKPQAGMTLSELAHKWDSIYKGCMDDLRSHSIIPKRKRLQIQKSILQVLKNIIQERVPRLPDENCEDLFEPFHPILRLGAHNISKSLETHHQLLNVMLMSFLLNKDSGLKDLGKSVGLCEKVRFVINTLYGKVLVTLRRGSTGGWRKKSMHIIIDLPKINEKGKKELPPLWSELISSDKIDPSWYLCQSKHGMIKFGCDGKSQLAEGVRLTLWCDSNGKGLIVGTAHTILKSDTTGQQDLEDPCYTHAPLMGLESLPDSLPDDEELIVGTTHTNLNSDTTGQQDLNFVNYPLSYIFRLNLQDLPDDKVETLYIQLDDLFKEIQSSCQDPLKDVSLKKFANPTFLATVALMAGLGFIWFKR